MEVEGEDGSKIVLQNVGDKVVFGRGFGFNTKDKTVSRQHVVFELVKSGESQTGSEYSKVSFEVVGKNFMWVREHGSGEIRAFRNGEKGGVIEGQLPQNQHLSLQASLTRGVNDSSPVMGPTF
ncbi:hypothetical protein SO802_005170 [Lithocarpus litseifolius]|uniref:FHA domain-containing protein n=1 Tax=Lithocarpus litseifolius TaxID=425828 RepID=A0AAW2DHW5_9ROSI